MEIGRSQGADYARVISGHARRDPARISAVHAWRRWKRMGGPHVACPDWRFRGETNCVAWPRQTIEPQGSLLDTVWARSLNLVGSWLIGEPTCNGGNEMNTTMQWSTLASAALVSFGISGTVQAQQTPPQSPDMTFFITSTGPGKGADLGGLEGADRQCQTLAQAAGAGSKTWRAYLSTQAAGDGQAVNARDRVGRGPWQNFKGEVVAQNVDDLHGDSNKLGIQTSLTERGTMVAGVGYTPTYHDILTGSQMDGRAFPPGEDRTCRNWTSSAQGAAMVGHSDRKGLRDDAASRSWNSAHPSRGPDGGCSQADLRSTGGAGLLYCFAAN
jgi:hypothetical protein